MSSTVQDSGDGTPPRPVVAPEAETSYDRRVAKQRRARVPRLYGVAEVGDALNVKVQNLQFIRDLPQPVMHVRATRLWLADEIDRFADVYKQRRAARGNHPKAA